MRFVKAAGFVGSFMEEQIILSRKFRCPKKINFSFLNFFNLFPPRKMAYAKTMEQKAVLSLMDKLVWHMIIF